MIDSPHKIVIFSTKLLSSSSLFYSPSLFSSSQSFFLHFLAMRFSVCRNFCWSLSPGNTHTLAHCQLKSKCQNPLDLSKKRWFRLGTRTLVIWTTRCKVIAKYLSIYFEIFYERLVCHQLDQKQKKIRGETATGYLWPLDVIVCNGGTPSKKGYFQKM